MEAIVIETGKKIYNAVEYNTMGDGFWVHGRYEDGTAADVRSNEVKIIPDVVLAKEQWENYNGVLQLEDTEKIMRKQQRYEIAKDVFTAMISNNYEMHICASLSKKNKEDMSKIIAWNAVNRADALLDELDKPKE